MKFLLFLILMSCSEKPAKVRSLGNSNNRELGQQLIPLVKRDLPQRDLEKFCKEYTLAIKALCLFDLPGLKSLVRYQGVEVLSKKNPYRWTPLMWASRNRQHEAVKFLLEKIPAALNKKDKNSRTALMYSLTTPENKTVVETLLSKKNIHIKTKDGWGETPLLLSYRFSYYFAFQIILDRGANPRERGLIISSLFDKKHQYLAAILNSGVNPNEFFQLPNENKNRRPLVEATLLGDETAVNILLSHKANPNLGDFVHLHTALTASIERENQLLAETFLKLPEILVNAKAPNNKTALQIAYEKNNTDLINLLKNNGAKLPL